jgi:hypothetical protein
MLAYISLPIGINNGSSRNSGYKYLAVLRSIWTFLSFFQSRLIVSGMCNHVSLMLVYIRGCLGDRQSFSRLICANFTLILGESLPRVRAPQPHPPISSVLAERSRYLAAMQHKPKNPPSTPEEFEYWSPYCYTYHQKAQQKKSNLRYAESYPCPDNIPQKLWENRYNSANSFFYTHPPPGWDPTEYTHYVRRYTDKVRELAEKKLFENPGESELPKQTYRVPRENFTTYQFDHGSEVARKLLKGGDISEKEREKFPKTPVPFYFPVRNPINMSPSAAGSGMYLTSTSQFRNISNIMAGAGGSQPAGTNASTPSDGTQLYCICNGPDDHRKMIGCDGGCQNWFHTSCIGLEGSEHLIDSYICVDCQVSDIRFITWKRLCRYQVCKKPISRRPDGTLSKYCSDEHAVATMKNLITDKAPDVEVPGGALSKARLIWLNDLCKEQKLKIRDLGRYPAMFYQLDDDPKLAMDQRWANEGQFDEYMIDLELDGDRLDFVQYPRDMREKRKQRLNAIVYYTEEIDKLASRKLMIQLCSKQAGAFRGQYLLEHPELKNKKKKKGERVICCWDIRLEWDDDYVHEWFKTPEGQQAKQLGRLPQPPAGHDIDSPIALYNRACGVTGNCKRHCGVNGWEDDLLLDVNTDLARYEVSRSKRHDKVFRMDEIITMRLGAVQVQEWANYCRQKALEGENEEVVNDTLDDVPDGAEGVDATAEKIKRATAGLKNIAISDKDKPDANLTYIGGPKKDFQTIMIDHARQSGRGPPDDPNDDDEPGIRSIAKHQYEKDHMTEEEKARRIEHRKRVAESVAESIAYQENIKKKTAAKAKADAAKARAESGKPEAAGKKDDIVDEDGDIDLF